MSTTKTRKRTMKAKPSKAKHEALVTDLSGLKLLGLICNWNTPDNRGISNLFPEVKKALEDNGLDVEVLKERTPATAFSRAINELTSERIIDVLRSDKDEVLFQFTVKKMVDDTDDASKMLEYKKETKVLLNKTTGELKCKKQTIKDEAQALLNKHMEKWTTPDISHVVQKLFDKESAKNSDLDLFTLGTGVFFVPAKHNIFVEKVAGFMSQLGRRLNRFPVPAGTQYGDASVQDSIVGFIKDLIDRHQDNIQGFTLQTRQDSIESQVERINQTRVKIEAYADYLVDRRQELLDALDVANTNLVKQVEKLTKERNGSVFAARPGSQAEMIDQAVGTTPITIKEIAAKTGLSVGRISGHLNLPSRQPYFTKVGDGWIRTTPAQKEALLKAVEHKVDTTSNGSPF